MIMTVRGLQHIFQQLEKDHQPTMLEQLRDHTPFQMLVATLLSARTKDASLIPIVKDLFREFPGPRELAKIPLPVLEKKLYAVGFFRVKAKNVKLLCRIILEKYDGTIPETFDELVLLPGVGRKTANCVLANAFQKPAIGVDTHVHRISNRLGWVATKSPEETELALIKIIPRKLWSRTNNLLVDHGQRVCFPRNPNCQGCQISMFCEFGQGVLEEKNNGKRR